MDCINKIIAAFVARFQPQTVADVMASFTKAIDQLDAVAAKQEAELVAANEERQKLYDKLADNDDRRLSATVERRRAADMRTKLADFVRV